MNYHLLMNYEDFLLRESSITIPLEVYKPQVRCPYCQSVHLSEHLCESCGRSLIYHPIGEAFGYKSFIGIKERYIESLNPWIRWYPLYEDKLSPSARKYCRHQEKRFNELLTALQEDAMPPNEERRYFYIELIFLIDELLSYGIPKDQIALKIENNFIESNQILSAELLRILHESNEYSPPATQKKLDVFLKQRTFGLSRDFIFKSTLIMATINFVAIYYYEFFSSLIGK